MSFRKLLVICCALLLPLAATQAQYVLKRSVVGNGCTPSQNASYRLSGTVGQPAVGVSNSAVTTAKHGFWYTLGGGSMLAIDLETGWNMISTNVVPGNISVANLMSQLGEDLVLVRDNSGNLYVPSESVNTINDLDITQGYQLYVRSPRTLTVVGQKVDPSTSIWLAQNWNIIAFLPQTAQSAETAFAGLTPELVIAKNGNGQFYMPAFGINTFEQGSTENGMLVPGKGYQIFMTDAKGFIYPATAAMRISPEASATEPICSYFSATLPPTLGNSSLVIVSDNCPESAEISVELANGTLVGSGVFHNGRAAVTLAASDEFHPHFAQLGDELRFSVYFPQTQQTASMTISSATNVITGEFSSTFRFAPNSVFVAKAKAEGIQNSSLELNCFPNPVSSTSTVEFVCPDGGATEIALYSLNGERVRTVFSGNADKSSRNVTNLDAEQLSSGVYSLVLRSPAGTIAKQITVVK